MTQIKPSTQRQNRTTKELGALPDDLVPNPPPAPKGWLPVTRARWDEFWGSPLAWTIRSDLDLDVLERVFLLRDTYARYARRTRAKPVVKGSTGQESSHPLIRAMPPIAAEIRQLEDRLGFTSGARLKLGIHLPDPQQTHTAEVEEDDDHSGAIGGDYHIPGDPRMYPSIRA